ncbi:MAG: tRNA epoxyqueuosine(34) reductase QueG [Cytophagales bacterium]
MMQKINSATVKQLAKELGFEFCGISKAGFLEKEVKRLEVWLKNNCHGKMSYMENHFDKRLDPTKLMEGTESVISVLMNYYPEKEMNSEVKISKYAYGEDYHNVLKDKLKELLFRIEEVLGSSVNARAFVDSAPIMDKVWAEKSGLGWIGKNSNLITKKSGSFFFIGELLVDLKLEPDGPIKDFCGTCTRCLEACPTDAIIEPYVVDGSKCISYLTIELKEEIPQDFFGKSENWMFGCDICQDVCPWNRFSKPHNENRFTPLPIFSELNNRKDWEELSEETFKKAFKNSPLKRAKFEGLKKNLEFSKNDILKTPPTS